MSSKLEHQEIEDLSNYVPSAEIGNSEDLSSDVTRKQSVKWLVTVLLINLAITIAITAVLIALGESAKKSLTLTGSAQIIRLKDLGAHIQYDSWAPMLSVYELKAQNPRADLYKPFFDEGVKFQYPPSSLLIFETLPDSLIYQESGKTLLRRVIGAVSWLSVLLTALVCAAIFEISWAKIFQEKIATVSKKQLLLRAVLVACLALTFYPVLKAYTLGQIQVFINLGLSIALLAYLTGYEGLAGGILAACCLVKPQYGILLLWGLLRRKRRFALVFVIALGLGLIASIAMYGVTDHLRYLEVLKFISSRGEAYWPNQSINGLLNRFLNNGNSSEFDTNQFAAYNPFVHIATVTSSILILAIALWPVYRKRRASGSMTDFVAVLVAATIASPVAWEHHYGFFIACFAAITPMLINERPFGRATLPLLCGSYLVMANAMLKPDLLLQNSFLGLLASHLFFGAIVFFAMLVALRKLATSRESETIEQSFVPVSSNISSI